jgi:hypothetical protein
MPPSAGIIGLQCIWLAPLQRKRLVPATGQAACSRRLPQVAWNRPLPRSSTSTEVCYAAAGRGSSGTQTITL